MMSESNNTPVLDSSPIWVEEVPRIESKAKLKGGIDGNLNAAARALSRRTAWLKEQLSTGGEGGGWPVVDWDLTPVEQSAKLRLHVPALLTGLIQRGVEIDDYTISDTYAADVTGMAAGRFGTEGVPSAGRWWCAINFGAATGTWSTVMSIGDETTGNSVASVGLTNLGGLRLYMPGAIVVDAAFVAGETMILQVDSDTGDVTIMTPRTTYTTSAGGPIPPGLTLLPGAWATSAGSTVRVSMHARSDMLPAGLTPAAGYEPLTELSAALPVVPSVPAYLNVTVGGEYRGIGYHPTDPGTCPAAILHDTDLGIVEPLPRDTVGKYVVQQMIDDAAPGITSDAKLLTSSTLTIVVDPQDLVVGAGSALTDVIKIVSDNNNPRKVVRILLSEDMANLAAGTELQLSFALDIPKVTVRRSAEAATDMFVRGVRSGDCIRLRKQNSYANFWEVVESVDTRADMPVVLVTSDQWPDDYQAKAGVIYNVSLQSCTPDADGVVVWGGSLRPGMRVCGIDFVGGRRLRVGAHDLWCEGHAVDVLSPGVTTLHNNQSVGNGNQGAQSADDMRTPGMRLAIGGADGSPTVAPGLIIVDGGFYDGVLVLKQTFIDFETSETYVRSGTNYGFPSFEWSTWISVDEALASIWVSLAGKMPASATTSAVPEGTRLYFTESRAVQAVLGELFSPVAGVPITTGSKIIEALQALANHATSTTYALIADLPAAAQNHGRTVYVTQARCTFFSNGAAWLQGRPGGFTYAEISALDPALFAGIDLFCSDYNAAVTCNGSRFIATGPITLKRGVGGNVNNTTAESIADATLIPRKILGVKHSVSIWIRAAAPTVSSITRIRLNTTASLTGATTGHFAHATAVTTAHTVEKEIRALSDTSQVSGGGATASSNTASNSSGVATSLSTAADYYVITSFAMTALSGSAQLSSVDVKAYPGD